MTDPLFSGLKVIDCATVIAAPAAAMMLADYGADVIKIEQPGGGDMLRMLSDISTTPYADNNWFWNLDGRNKRSLAVDLKTSEGIAILRKLVSACDVFITNQPYSVRESLGITFEDLKPLNERMIYASLTAYGEKGPEKYRKGFDQLAYWARSGLMDLMRAPGTKPTQGLPGMGDHPTGVALYAGIVTALLHRERTGEGGMVQTSLLANGLWSASGIAQGAFAGGDMASYRALNAVDSAMMRPYQTQDGRWLQFNMVRNEELLSLLFIALDASELLSDERFATLELMFENRKALGDALQAIVQTRDASTWMSVFEEFDLPINLIAIIEDLMDDEQIRQNSMCIDVDDSVMDTPRLIRHPIQISSVQPVDVRQAPGLGEHSAEVLRELGYTDDEIASLIASRAVDSL